MDKPFPKLPPHSKESEMMVLGCMLTSINSLNFSADALDGQDFYFDEHKIIFQSLKNAHRNDKPADCHIISEDLKRQNKLHAVGGVVYLTTLAQYAGTSAYIEEYVENVKKKAILRKLIQSSQETIESALNDPPDVSMCVDEAQASLFQIGQQSTKRNGMLTSEMLSGLHTQARLPFLKELEARQERYLQRGENDPVITGIQTHYAELDLMIDGLNNSHLLILAGRPAMGKTALALNITENVCFRNKLPVGIFSLEMTADEILLRIISSQSAVESNKIRTGSLNNKEFHQVVEAVSGMQDYVMVIDDQPSLKITELRARARKMKDVYDIKFLMIDYLQLISGSRGSSGEHRVQEISEISRMLKILARELEIPILCLSQLSRKAEERRDHKPLMSDLRESGSIEQDADIIMLLFRQEYYTPSDNQGRAELNVAKNRHGPTGNIHLYFQKELAQFSPLLAQVPHQPFAVSF